MRLVVKAVKYIKRWRGKDGKYNYEYPKKAAGAKADALHEKVGSFGKMSVPSNRSFYIAASGDNPNDPNKKILVPHDHIGGMFTKFGKQFIVHHTIDKRKKVVNPNEWSVTEVTSGKRVSWYKVGKWEDARKAVIGVIDKTGIGAMVRIISQQPDIVIAPDSSVNVESFYVKAKNLDEKGKTALYERLAVQLEDYGAHTPDAIGVWVEEHYDEDDIADIENDLAKSGSDWQYLFGYAIAYDIEMSDVLEFLENVGLVVAIPGVSDDIDDIVEWARKVKIDLADVDWEQYAYYDQTAGAEMDWEEIVLEAYRNDEHPQEAYDRMAALIEDQKREDEEESEILELGFEGTPEYDDSRGEYYDLPTDEAESAIKSGHVIGMGALGGGVNHSFRVQLSNGDECEVAFKPTAGEDHSIRRVVPDKFAEREVLAYELDKLLGINLVPPTRMLEIEGQEGSAQFYVHNAVPSAMSGYGVFRNMPEHDLLHAAMLDYLMYNTDRHSGNWLVDSGGSPVLIDNGLGFPTREESFRSAFRDQMISINVETNISDDEMSVLRGVDIEPFIDRMHSFDIEDSAIEGFKSRWNEMLGVGAVPSEYNPDRSFRALEE